MKKELLAAMIAGAGIVMSMFATGCSDGAGGGDKDTLYINAGTKDTIIVAADTVYIGTRDTIYLGGGSWKLLLPIRIYRNRTDGTYNFVSITEGWLLYAFPKLIVNGIEADVQYFGDIELYMDGIPAGDLTYSIIWDDDTLTRTVNLPNNTYMLAESHTETHYRYSVAGGNGNEKVIWRYNYRDSDDEFIYKGDTLSVSETLILPKTFNYYSLNWSVMHKDTKPFAPGYTATAESKKIAVVEEIQLWSFWDY